ncbi:MAG TPA: YidC/Oxa1 family membrane protein insertase [Acidimicrobiales bacterium]|nr:YidC/Oxa1 family membrane protein insertase [Acidimicrobiales bacterium]
MFGLLADALAFFYDLWPSYGMAIVLFTIAIYLVLTPLTIKSTRSMIAMQRVQPELKKLQEKHKNDKEALQREMMAFYQANNINPFSSCLPMLLQMPIFFVLFQVLNKLTRIDPETGNFDPSYIDPDSKLAVALRGTDEMVSWGLDLARSASGVLQDDGIIRALPFLLLVGLTAVTAWYQQKQVQGRRMTDQSQMPQQQQVLLKILPFMITFFSFTMPAGVVVYFVVSALVRIGQQAFVTRLEFPELRKAGAGPGPASTNGTKTPKAPKPAPASTVVKEPKPVPPSPRVAQGQTRNSSRNRKRKRK